MGRKKGAILSFIMMAFEILSTLLLTPFIIRTLGQAEYGVYKLSVAIVSYLLLLDLGVGNAVVRYVAKYRFDNDSENCSRFLGISTVYYLFVGLLSFIVGIVFVFVYPYVFAKGLSIEEIEIGKKLLLITTITNTVTLTTSSYANTLNAYERFDITKGWGIAQCVLKIVFIYISLRLGFGSIALVSIDLGLTVVCRLLFVFFVLYKIKIKPVFKQIDFSFIKEIVVYSSFILLQMIATQVNNFTDQILIGALIPCSSAVLAVYAVGQQISNYFQNIGAAFTGILMPGVVKMVKQSNNQEIQKEMVRIGRIIFTILSIIFVGFLLYGRTFICLWAGKENEDAFIVSSVLMFCFLFICTESIGSQILWALNEHKEQSILKISIVLANVILTIFLIKWNALIGATIGTAIALFLGDIVIMNMILHKKLKISIVEYYTSLFNGIIPALLLSAVIGYICTYIPISGWCGLLLKIALMLASYIAFMLLFGFNSNEKSMLFGILNKVFKGSKTK